MAELDKPANKMAWVSKQHRKSKHLRVTPGELTNESAYVCYLDNDTASRF